MVQADTSGALSTEPEPAEKEPPPSWFVYEGPKISFTVTLGTAKTLTLLGFQAVTNISHEQSIALGAANADVNGPLYAGLEIAGPRKKISMDLGAKLELAPGAFIHRLRARLAARGVEVDANAGQQNVDGGDVGAQVAEVENVGTQNDVGPGLNANVSHNQA